MILVNQETHVGLAGQPLCRDGLTDPLIGAIARPLNECMQFVHLVIHTAASDSSTTSAAKSRATQDCEAGTTPLRRAITAKGEFTDAKCSRSFRTRTVRCSIPTIVSRTGTAYSRKP